MDLGNYTKWNAKCSGDRCRNQSSHSPSCSLHLAHPSIWKNASREDNVRFKVGYVTSYRVGHGDYKSPHNSSAINSSVNQVQTSQHSVTHPVWADSCLPPYHDQLHDSSLSWGTLVHRSTYQYPNGVHTLRPSCFSPTPPLCDSIYPLEELLQCQDAIQTLPAAFAS